MKKLSIKSRVTLWYTAFMVIIVTIMFSFVIAAGDSLSRSSAQSRLVNAVENSFEEIEFDDGRLDIDDDLDYFQNGVYISVYNQDGNLIYGRTPNGFNHRAALIEGPVRKVSEWNVYDSSVNINGYGEVWIRGVASLSELEDSISALIRLTLIALPFLVIVAGFGGYYITKRAFGPIRRIIDSAEKIGGGKDLSERIGLGEGRDEIYTLASTFDKMFDRLEDSFESEKQFTSDASHELRTPLAVIISQCEYAIEHGERLDETKQNLQVVLEQARKMSHLISRLLTLARADRGEQKLELELINFSEITELIVEEQRILAIDKRIIVTADIEPDIILRADQTLMMRMLINLISNAIRYGKKDGHVWVKIEKEGNLLKGYIKDDGVGIGEEHLNKIWNRFYRADSSRTVNEESGAGLGLAMVKWIVQAHRGKVSVASTLNEGSIFSFEIPIL